MWNQAYQENSEPDSVRAALAGARGCYVLLDPFDSVEAREAIPALQAFGNRVGCYVSVGTCEDWREDFNRLRGFCTSTQWPEWPGEFFISDAVGALPLMKARVDQLAAWGCDMVEFDNMDWAEDDEARALYGFEVDAQGARGYFRALCDHVHAAGMGCMAKNTREGAEGFDGGTFESYAEEMDWWERDHLKGFLDAGQLGVVVHYDERDCDRAALFYRQRYGEGLSFICEDRALGGYRH